MARMIEGACRLCRRAGEKLGVKGSKCATPKCALDRRNRPPGARAGSRQRRLSDRGVQLREKQKARFTYGIMEAQFKKIFLAAENQPGITKDNLLVSLERRLDNIVYRIGFADSRAQARQLVRHGHIAVNGRKLNVPSAVVKEGDNIGWTAGGAKTEYYKLLVESIKSKLIPNWLSLDKENMTGQVISLPTPDQIEAKFDGKIIVEYYSR